MQNPNLAYATFIGRYLFLKLECFSLNGQLDVDEP
jgi:hypothetical protein